MNELPSPFFVLGWSAAALFLSLLFWLKLALVKQRTDLADVAWGMGFVLVAWVSYFLGPDKSLYEFVVTSLVTIWGLRLSGHILLRLQFKPEDYRYSFVNKGSAKDLFLKVFLLQGALLYIIALPVMWINTVPLSLDWRSALFPISLWASGFYLEAVSDWQLRQFTKHPANKGRLFRDGLFAFCRHPNYLGEIIQWWAIWFFVLPYPFGSTFIISPILITFLLIKVSGIPLLEKKQVNHPDFTAYAQTTPRLFPPFIINFLVYSIGWFLVIFIGKEGYTLSAAFLGLLFFGLQLLFLYNKDYPSFLIALPLAGYTLFLGFVQETLMIQTGVLSYANSFETPPSWILLLYPLFGLTLTAYPLFLHYLPLAFLCGGSGALFSYSYGEGLRAVTILQPTFLFLFWGTNLTLIAYLTRKLLLKRQTFTDPVLLSHKLTVVFDAFCPICAWEMETLQKKPQTGKVVYTAPCSQEELSSITDAVSYEEAMKEMVALDDTQHIYKGTQALAQLYARTGQPILSIMLEAPGFDLIATAGYKVWARFRPRNSACGINPPKK